MAWVKDLGQGGREKKEEQNANQMFKADRGGQLCSSATSPPFPGLFLFQEALHSFLKSLCPSKTWVRTHRHAYTQYFGSDASPPPPLAYLVEWPWKTKQVLSTFDFSAFKLILSAQLLKQLSSPAVSNFRLGTFTGCQVFRGCIVDLFCKCSSK